MPLLPGKKNIGKNTKELQRSGRSKRQSIAIALETARRMGIAMRQRKEA